MSFTVTGNFKPSYRLINEGERQRDPRRTEYDSSSRYQPTFIPPPQALYNEPPPRMRYDQQIPPTAQQYDQQFQPPPQPPLGYQQPFANNENGGGESADNGNRPAQFENRAPVPRRALQLIFNQAVQVRLQLDADNWFVGCIVSALTWYEKLAVWGYDVQYKLGKLMRTDQFPADSRYMRPYPS